VKREKSVINICAAGMIVNLVLFFVKLYVSLSANSISIFSDAVNNLADSLSCLLTVGCMVITVKLAKNGAEYLSAKLEQLLSFVLSIVVAVVGLSFAYSSLERMMYPTPVWFTEKYFFVIAVTAAVKLAMFFIYRRSAKKSGSEVIRVMQTDSITDFCVTGITLVSFVMTKYTDFKVDAYAGILVSIIIVIAAVKLIKTSLCGVINFVPEKKRRLLEEKIEERTGKPAEKIIYSVDADNRITAYVQLDFEENFAASQIEEKCREIKKGCFEASEIDVQIITF